MAYLPIDKHGADLLFQIISQRYERAPMVITSNRAYKHWSQIFNNDSTLEPDQPCLANLTRWCRPMPQPFTRARGRNIPLSSSR